ncbi:MAG: molybdenum ABC transporter ATP-binding protein [Alphaproteobacteria bacterium]
MSNNIHICFDLQYQDSSAAAFGLNIDLQIPGRGITAIFGQSGSGKTTVLRLIAGLKKLPTGYLSVHGEVWQNNQSFLPPHKRHLGYVFQESSLFNHLTAQNNLNYAIKRAKNKPNKISYQQVVELMGIEPILGQYPHQLSGGERQRVAIARALLTQPQLLLMDEPLASLDAARKQEIMPYLEKLRSSLNIPIIYVSHSMDEVARLADYMVLLEQGQVIKHGKINEVLSTLNLPLPIGSDANVIWQGQVIERDEKWHLVKVATNGGELWVRDNGDGIGHDMRVRICASDVSLSHNNHEDSSILNRLWVKIDEIMPDKDEAMMLVRLKAGDDYLIARLTQRSAHHLGLNIGQNIWAQIKSVALVH